MKTRTKRLLALLLGGLIVGTAWLFPPPEHHLLAKAVTTPGCFVSAGARE